MQVKLPSWAGPPPVILQADGPPDRSLHRVDLGRAQVCWRTNPETRQLPTARGWLALVRRTRRGGIYRKGTSRKGVEDVELIFGEQNGLTMHLFGRPMRPVTRTNMFI